MITLKQYLDDGKAIINDTIVNLFSFLEDTSAEGLTDIIALKYDAAEMYHTAENQVLHDTQTALIMYKDQLEKLYSAYTMEYDPAAGYSKEISETVQHSGTDTDEDEVRNTGIDSTSSTGSSDTATEQKSRTYDDNTMTVTDQASTEVDDSNSTSITHGHKINTDHDKTYGHKVVTSMTETGTLPIEEALRDYVEFNRFNFLEYVADIIAMYITIPAFKIGGLENEF